MMHQPNPMRGGTVLGITGSSFVMMETVSINPDDRAATWPPLSPIIDEKMPPACLLSNSAPFSFMVAEGTICGYCPRLPL